MGKQAYDADTVYTIRKGACFGTCPVYTLEVKGNGHATLNADNFINKQGFFSKKLSKDEMKKLVRLFDKADLFNHKDSYNALIQDLPTHVYAIKIGGRNKKVEGNATPSEFDELSQYANELVEGTGWINDNAQSFVVDKDQEQTSFIVQLESKTNIEKWIKNYSGLQAEVDKVLSKDENIYLIRYNNSLISPPDFFQKLERDSNVESVDINKKTKLRNR